jgi:hypothetical protein
VSLERLEARLAQLLSTPALTVDAGALPGSEADLAAAVAVELVTPRQPLGATLPLELRPRELRRVSFVTTHVAVSVRPGTGAGARASALAAATTLWWQCEDSSIASASAFPRDPAEGYFVDAVRPVAWRTPDDPDTADAHRLELDVDAAVWPRDVPVTPGDEISHALVRMGAAAPAVALRPLVVRAGETLTVPIELDLRSMVLGDPADAPEAAPRRADVELVPLGADAPAGTVEDSSVELVGDRVTFTYHAGPDAGRDDELRISLRAPDGRAVPAGGVIVTVVP